MIKYLHILLLVLISTLSKAQYGSSEFYTQVTFPSNYQIGDYIEFASTTPIDVFAAGYFEVSISYTRGNIAAAATFSTSISHANPDLWREAGMINANDYVLYKNRNFTIDVNGGKRTFRVRAVNTIGVAGSPLPVNIKIRSVNQVDNWTAMNVKGNDSNVSFLQPMTDEWNLYVGNLTANESAKIALKAISNGNVGIGTATPLAQLHVATNRQDESSLGALFIGEPSISLRLGTTNDYSWIQSHGSKPLYVNTLGNNIILNKNGGNVGIGMSNPQNKLDVNGTVHAKEVKVDMSGWADFVFQKDYPLPSLEEIEKHINEKGHLANIPTTKEIMENGLLLGENQKLLLQKIEELTLYIIEQHKLNKIQSEQLQQQIQINKSLEQRLQKLEKTNRKKIIKQKI